MAKRKKKSNLQKKKDNPKSTYWRTRADKLWGEYMHTLHTECFIKDGNCKGTLEAHHLISRSNALTRHNPLCGIILCSWHHKFSKTCSPHAGPIGFSAYLQDHYPERYNWVLENQFKTGKPDYEAAYEILEMLLLGTK